MIPRLPVLYSRTRSPASLAIRAASWFGPWSHCAVIAGEFVIECLALKGGVVRTPIDEAIKRASRADWVLVNCPNPERALAWARSTIGLPYDWSGVAAMPFRARNWQEPGKWYCSEHVEAALAIGGSDRWQPGLHGISPNQSYFNR